MEQTYTYIGKLRGLVGVLSDKGNCRGRSIAVSVVACGLGLMTAYSVWAGLLVAVFLAYCFVIYIKPIYGIYITIFFIPIMTIDILYDNRARSLPEKYPLGAIFFLLSYAAMMVRRGVLGGHGRKVHHIASYMLLFFVAWFAVTFFWTLSAAHGLNLFSTLILGIMIMQIIENDVINRKALHSIMVCVAICGFIWAGIMLFSFYWFGTIYEEKLMELIRIKIEIYTQNKRIGGFGSPMVASSTLGMVVFFLIAIWSDAGWRGRIFYLIVGYLCITAMIIAVSKGAIGGLFAGLIITTLIDSKLRRKGILMVSSALSFSAIAYLLTIVILNQQRLSGGAKVATYSFSVRLVYWATGFKSLFESSWFGEGIGGYGIVANPVPDAHSVYFNILFDGGAIASVLFVLFVLMRLISDSTDVLRSNDDFYTRKFSCLIGAFTMFFIHALVDLNYTSRHFWMMLGISGAMAAIARRETASKGVSSDR